MPTASQLPGDIAVMCKKVAHEKSHGCMGHGLCGAALARVFTRTEQ